jgi:hypothetical protein
MYRSSGKGKEAIIKPSAPILIHLCPTHLLVVEFTDVLLFDRLEIIESPQFTTVPFEIENVRKR